MCGIAGVVAFGRDATTDEKQIATLRDAQAHRGPDDAGLWISEDRRVGLGHRRLSIIDLSETGHQPMATADGRLRLVYNGEIYNFRELRRELERLGYRFRSTSDTEVLLHGYRAWGLTLLDRLRGMFAFALHDSGDRSTLLARDPLGIKPLYTLEDGSRLVFASEVQALRQTLDAGDVDPEGLASYLQWGSIPPPRTLYSRIRALPPGCWLRVGERGPEAPRPYFSLADCFGHDEPMDAEQAARALREALRDSARAHRIADVPVGAFLSGGVDSSALLGLLSEEHSSVRAVTLCFDDPALDEGPLARQAAALYGADHHEIPIRIEEIRERIPDAIRALDQPSIDGINTYFVSEAAVRAGLKVAVSGVGGDELFGGYESFRRVPRLRRAHEAMARIPFARPLRAPLVRMLGALPPARARTKLSLALAGGGDAGAYFAERGLYTPEDTRAMLAPQLAEAVEASDPVAGLQSRLGIDGIPEEDRVSALELTQYLQAQLLRDTDAVSMRHSLEVRTPLVDRELLRAAARVPARWRLAGPAKRYLREAPTPPVPEALWKRPKQGFTLPFDRWLRSGAIAIELPDHPWLRADALTRVVDAYRRGRIHFSRVWQLIVLREFLC